MSNWTLILLAGLIKILPILAYVPSCDVVEAFEDNSVVPDILTRAPRALLKVTYDDDVLVDLGNELTPTQMEFEPEVHWYAYSRAYYIVMMLDLDFESRENPTHRSAIHWLVTNIPGNKVDRGEVLDAYIEPAPPRDTGLHRYVYLVYKQPGRLEFDEIRAGNDSLDGRFHFDPEAFATKYRLYGPIAGNLALAEWDLTAQEILEDFGFS